MKTSGLNWNLDELVAKVMNDLRGTDAENSAARVGVALARDFEAVRRRENSPKNAEKEEEAVLIENEATKDAEADGSLDVSARVIAVETVRDLARSTSRKIWRVRSDAVLTPAANDELKKLGVALIFAERDAEPIAGFRGVTISASNVFSTFETSASVGVRTREIESTNGEFPIFLALHLPETERLPRFVEEYLARNFVVSTVRFDCLKKTTSQIASEITKNTRTRTILATHDAAIASIWANRLSGVRAVVAFSFEQATRDLEATDANVVVVDPRDVGPYPARKIVEFFLKRNVKNKI